MYYIICVSAKRGTTLSVDYRHISLCSLTDTAKRGSPSAVRQTASPTTNPPIGTQPTAVGKYVNNVFIDISIYYARKRELLTIYKVNDIIF